MFIDGSNFYHAARGIGIATGDLDYRVLADKLILDRRLAGITSAKFRVTFLASYLKGSFWTGSGLRVSRSFSAESDAECSIRTRIP